MQDAEKTQLEVEKLELEVKSLRRRWIPWIPVFCALVAAFTLWLTGDYKLAEAKGLLLKYEAEKQEDENRRFRDRVEIEKKAIEGQMAALAKQKADLEGQVRDLLDERKRQEQRNLDVGRQGGDYAVRLATVRQEVAKFEALLRTIRRSVAEAELSKKGLEDQLRDLQAAASQAAAALEPPTSEAVLINLSAEGRADKTTYLGDHWILKDRATGRIIAQGWFGPDPSSPHN